MKSSAASVAYSRYHAGQMSEKIPTTSVYLVIGTLFQAARLACLWTRLHPSPVTSELD